MKNTDLSEFWLASARGQQLVSAERRHLEEALSRLFGRTMLQIGEWAPGLLRTASHWRTGVLGAGGEVQVVCDLSALPLASHCVDAVLLAHSLESAPSAHRLLREVDEVLSPRGQLLILGFNPVSWWGLRQRLLPRYPVLPPSQRLLSSRRIQDWLRLLDYEVVRCERFGSTALPRQDLLQPLLSFFAPAYLIHARKCRVPVNPLPRPVWRRAAAQIQSPRWSSTRGGGGIVVPFVNGENS